MKNQFKFAYIFFFSAFCAFISSHDLESAIQSKERSLKNMARDEYRNPYETLKFFEINLSNCLNLLEFSPIKLAGNIPVSDKTEYLPPM